MARGSLLPKGLLLRTKKLSPAPPWPGGRYFLEPSGRAGIPSRHQPRAGQEQTCFAWLTAWDSQLFRRLRTDRNKVATPFSQPSGSLLCRGLQQGRNNVSSPVSRPVGSLLFSGVMQGSNNLFSPVSWSVCIATFLEGSYFAGLNLPRQLHGPGVAALWRPECGRG